MIESDGEPITVLHVDDDPEFLELAAAFLERESDRISVLSETGIDVALDRIDDAGPVDCVVSDYDLEASTGLDLLRAVRDADSDLPFILFTGKGSEEIASEAVSAGVTDYLQKEGGAEQYAVLANRIENAVGRYRARRQAAEERRINDLIREVLQQAVQASTRAAIEETVCSSFAESEPFVFAWIGEPDPETSELEPRAWGGIEREYLEEITVRIDDTPLGQGPGGRAVRTREPQVAQRISEDPSFEPWRETAREYGFESLIVLPLVHDDELYGTLSIYADRPDAFDQGERAVLEELAEAVARMIAAVEVRTRLQERERLLERLHEATRELPAARTKEDIGEVAVGIAEDVLDRSVASVHLLDEDDGVLRAAANTTEAEVLFDAVPDFTEGDALAWRTFESGEVAVFDDLDDESGRYNPDTPVRSEIQLPLGDHGLLTIGSTVERGFEPSDSYFARILAANAEAAMDRAERERTLRRREAELGRYETVVESLGDPVYALDDQGRFTFVNEAFEAMTGYTEDELEGEDISRIVEDGDVLTGNDMVWNLIADDGANSTIERDVITADGEHVPCEIHVALLPHEDDRQGVAGVIRAITDRRERERELRRQNERLEEFASVVSHDLKNPLNVAQGQLTLAREDGDLGRLDKVEAAHDRMHRLIEDLLWLAREGRQVGATEPVPLREIVERAWRNSDTGEATLAFDGDDGVVQADDDRLCQLFENLFTNAVEHGGEGVSVTVGTREDGFFVEDDGPGIPTEVRDRVFESGYSTVDDGTGFGLAIVAEIAEGHGWDVAVSDGTRGGTRIEFRGVSERDGGG